MKKIDREETGNSADKPSFPHGRGIIRGGGKCGLSPLLSRFHPTPRFFPWNSKLKAEVTSHALSEDFETVSLELLQRYMRGGNAALGSEGNSLKSEAEGAVGRWTPSEFHAY